MYEARQNKEKVSRRIDAAGGVIQNVRGILSDRRKNKFHASQVVQKESYMETRSQSRGRQKPTVPCYNNGIDVNGDVCSLWRQGMQRPVFYGNTENELYNNPKTDDKGRKLYLCMVSPNETKYLPRKKDSVNGEDFATIGHKMQWQEYARNNAAWNTYHPTRDPYEWGFISTSYQDVKDKFNDTGNLQLEGYNYNRGHAYTYGNSDDPLTQEWVE